jgi:UDP-2,3-diacylglucosamine hydrolase
LAASLVLPAAVQAVDFISDLHLSPDLPRTVRAFEQYLAHTRADAVFILGDLFEAWVGDDMLSQPFEAACGQALKAAAGRMPVHVMRGNRDFLLGPAFFQATDCIDLPDPQPVQAFGQTLLLTHGDAWCLADVDYLRFRSMVRAPAWQATFLAKPLAERLVIAAQMRAASRAHQGARDPVTYADVDGALAGQWLADSGADTLIHGHTHRPCDEQRESGWRRCVLSDWDLDHVQPPRAEVLRWSRSGLTRLPLEQA